MTEPIDGDDLTGGNVETVEVKTKPTNVQTKIGDKEFVTQFSKLISGGPVWRTPKTLAEKLDVDPLDLMTWMDKQPPLCRKAGKEDGTIFYAAVERLAQADDKRPPGLDRKAVAEEDRYLVAELNLIFNNLHDVLNKRGMRAYERSEEGFKALVQARDRLDAGLAMVANKMGVDRSKLLVTGR